MVVLIGVCRFRGDNGEESGNDGDGGGCNSYQRDPGCQILRRQLHQNKTFEDLSSSASG